MRGRPAGAHRRGEEAKIRSADGKISAGVNWEDLVVWIKKKCKAVK
jgi:hypothetical protein